jgi:hypothetical protein
MEEYRLNVIDNRMLKKIFSPKKDEITGGWKKLQSKNQHDVKLFT